MSHWVRVMPPIPFGIRGDVCPATDWVLRRPGQTGSPTASGSQVAGNGQAFAVTIHREVPP